MIKVFKKNKAQIMTEYSVVITTIMVSFIIMGIYVKRAIQARIHGAHQSMYTTASEAHSRFGLTGELLGEYEPYYSDTKTDSKSEAAVKQQLSPGGMTGVFKSTIDAKSESKTKSVTAPPKESN